MYIYKYVYLHLSLSLYIYIYIYTYKIVAGGSAAVPVLTGERLASRIPPKAATRKGNFADGAK